MRKQLVELLSGVSYRCSVALTRMVVFSLARWEIVGAERVPPTGPLILVANHVHLLDPPLVAGALSRRVHPMAKRELFEAPVVGWFFWLYGAFPVRRFSADLGALRTARSFLRAGEAVLMFPEGTRARGDEEATTRMRPALPGAALVALTSRAPIVPVAISGSNVPLPGVFYAWARRRRPRIRLEFGEPFVIAEGGADITSAEAATDHMMRRVAALLPPAQRGVYGEQTAGQVVVARQSSRPPRGEIEARGDD
ncbi:MAG: lysophospholipid acyltransferase family protein [Dehalococcoidia bacterium]